MLTRKYPSDYFSKVSNKIVTIGFQNHITRVGKYSEDQVAVMDENGLIGLGPVEWFKDVQHDVRNILQYYGKRDQAGSHSMYEEIDDM